MPKDKKNSGLPRRPSSTAVFVISFFLTLALLMPLLGSMVLYSGWQNQQQAKEADRSQSGVPIIGPGPSEDITLLVTVAREKPGFVLLRLNAPEARLWICPLPGESVLCSPGGPVRLEESYQAAGPGRAAALLAETLQLTIDRYLALTPESIGRIWGTLPPPRVNLSGVLSSQELGGLEIKDDPVVTLRPQQADSFIQQVNPGPARRARLQGVIWEAALRQQLPELPKVIVQGLRSESGSLLGNMTAADLFSLEKSLDWLARQETQVEAELVPGHYDRRTHRYEFDAESLAFIKERFLKPSERLASPTPQPESEPESESEQEPEKATPD